MWGRGRRWSAAGALPFGRSRCGLRRSAPDGACAGGSNKSTALALDASSGRVLVCARARRLCYCHCCVVDGDDSNLYRVGTSEGPAFASRVPPAAQMLPSRLSSYACHRCIVATFVWWTTKLWQGLARRFERAPRGTEHLPDRAFSRRAMGRPLRAMPRPAHAQRRPHHPRLHGRLHVRAHTISRMQRLLHPNFNSCITVFHAPPAQASPSLNSPAHTRMF